MPRNNTTTAILLLLTATTASSFVPSIDDLSSRTAAAFHAITEDFQRSLLAAQFANNNNNSNQPGSPSPTKSIKSVQSSVDYDAAARLAYESSNSNQDFTTYKQTYLAEKSTLIATKQRTRVAKEKAAEAKEKAKKAAEAAMIAKEKAQAKIREREEAAAAVVAAAEAYEDVLEKETGGDDVVVPSEPVVETATVVAATEVKEPTPPSSTKPSSTSTTTGSKSMAIVPINEATTQFTAGALGAAAGLLLGGGPFLAMFLSATANYLSRKEDDDSSPEDVASPKRIVDKVAQTALLIYNYVAQLERENQIVDGTFKAIGGAVDKAKKQSPDSSTGETITAIESTFKGVTKNIEQLNDEFDLVGGAGTVLNSVGDLVEDSVDKVIDLNEQYQLVERVGGVVKGAVQKVSEKKE